MLTCRKLYLKRKKTPRKATPESAFGQPVEPKETKRSEKFPLLADLWRRAFVCLVTGVVLLSSFPFPPWTGQFQCPRLLRRVKGRKQ